MKHFFNSTYLYVARLNRQHIQLFMLLFSLIIFVIGAGAPIGSGDGRP